jgi:CelD/BcsL family acetyltransferase involved in cellulose biosynthesis
MNTGIRQVDFKYVRSQWLQDWAGLDWPVPFILPGWLESWWTVLGSDEYPFLLAVYDQGSLLGIAPLMLKDRAACFMGHPDVCDYQDMIVAGGYEKPFYRALLAFLRQERINRLELRQVRQDSKLLELFVPLAREAGCRVITGLEAVSREMLLPLTWESYLDRLDSKQRHEVRRKLRRLQESAEIRFFFTSTQEDNKVELEHFLRLFPLSRQDKADFMTDQMIRFFRQISASMNSAGLLRFGCLEVGGHKVAMIMVFDYNNTIYLYNSAYDPAFSDLSVGIISKVLGIKESIRMGRSRWDFLKGAEAYKGFLGGATVSLYDIDADIKY